jgi:hypothetical protein
MPSTDKSNNSRDELAIKNDEAIEFLGKSVAEHETTTAENSQASFKHREGGVWAWLVVIASGYCFGILIGMVNNYALIYNGLEKAYNSTENYVVYTGK